MKNGACRSSCSECEAELNKTCLKSSSFYAELQPGLVICLHCTRLYVLASIEPTGLFFFLCILFYNTHRVAADLISTTLPSQLTLKKNCISHQQANLLVFTQALQKVKAHFSLPWHSSKPETNTQKKGHTPMTYIQRWETCHSISPVLLSHSTQHLHGILSLTPGNVFICCNPHLAPTVTSRSKFCLVSSQFGYAHLFSSTSK